MTIKLTILITEDPTVNNCVKYVIQFSSLNIGSKRRWNYWRSPMWIST